MAYADQDQTGRKTVSIIIVMLLHAALAYAFITGLAINVIKKAASELKVVDVDEPPPPPPAPPPPPPDVPKNLPPPPIVSPPPIVNVPNPAPVMQTVTRAPPVIITPTAPVAPPAPPPPKPSQAVGLKPRGAPGDWVTNDDYPSDALRDNAEGTTGFTLEVGPDGKVTNCTVTSSSGNSSLDQTACRLLPRRARFTPAKDSAGNGMASSFSSRIRWQIPKE